MASGARICLYSRQMKAHSHLHTIVIGGSRGLGRSVAKVFARDGHSVSVVSRHKLTDIKGDLHNYPADVSNIKALRKALDQAVKTNGPVHNVVFAQRFRGDKNVWDGEISTALTATHEAIEHLTSKFSSDGGSILIVSSVLWDKVSPKHHAGYHVAKAGAVQLARHYALTLGPKQIRVNAVSPCTFVKDESADYFRNNKALMALYKKVIPLQRLPHADEIAEFLLFLCGPKAAFLTGQNLVLDGGFSLRWIETLIKD